MCNAFLPFISVLFLLIQASMQKNKLMADLNKDIEDNKKLLMERMDILTNASEIYNKTLESLRNLEGWNQDCIEPTKQDYKLLNRLLNDIKKQLENEIKST
ncbi:unnamed protein product [Schistosoma turkestanicum]|nr:unnamed protein product [Schistosoma turkestanicum]